MVQWVVPRDPLTSMYAKKSKKPKRQVHDLTIYLVRPDGWYTTKLLYQECHVRIWLRLQQKTIANPSLWWWCTKGSFNIKLMANSKGTLDLCKINFDTKL